MKRNIFGLTYKELEDLFASEGLDRYRADQVFYWMYNRLSLSFNEMTNLSKALRLQLAESFEIRHPEIAGEQRSSDGTKKFLLKTADGLLIEAVLIRAESEESGEPKRLTLCVSTQVGCPLDCAFCVTATMKLKRNLSVGEIVGQYAAVQLLVDERITNLVYMGMGEPFLNYDACMASVEIITHEKTCGVSSSHITISTAGLADGIRRLADERRKVKLAISLHASTDELRSALMPVNRKYALAEVVKAAEYYYKKMRRRITWEYIVFHGINDGPEDVRRLVRLARRVPSKINLIPYHPFDREKQAAVMLPVQPSTPAAVEAFAKKLRDEGLTIMLRSSSGKDISAACGQLAVKQTTVRRAEKDEE